MALRRYWGNPLHARERERWRPWALPVGLLAALATLAACACGAVTFAGALSTAGVWSQSDRGAIALVGSLALVLPRTLGGLGWLATLVVLPVLAAIAVTRERATGAWELLRVTPLTTEQLVDGYFVRILLRYPIWLLLLPLLPLGVFSFESVFTFGVTAPEAGPAGAQLAALVLVQVGLAVLTTLVSLAQLAASVQIGLAAGAYADTPGPAAAITVGALAALQWIVPASCSACASLVALMATSGITSSATPSLAQPFAISGAITQFFGLVYQAALFAAARRLACRRIDQRADAP